MGIQALNDADLRALGRMHDTAEAIRAFEVARAIFPRVSFDLIYARQGQTLADWQAELGRALEMAIDHLSLYQLTIEAGTRFGDLAARGRLRGLPDAEAAADMYLATAGDLRATPGCAAYEISNHARPGAESRHNLDLLALRRLCRHRAGRARAADAATVPAGRSNRCARRRPGSMRSSGTGSGVSLRAAVRRRTRRSRC